MITQVNTQHAVGYGLDNSTGNAFFTGSDAADINLNAVVAGDANKVAAASATGLPGDASNALAIADLEQALTMNGGLNSFSDFYFGAVGRLGIRIEEARNQADNQAFLRDHVETLRDSVSGVSLDEEMGELIKFQRAFRGGGAFGECGGRDAGHADQPDGRRAVERCASRYGIQWTGGCRTFSTPRSACSSWKTAWRRGSGSPVPRTTPRGSRALGLRSSLKLGAQHLRNADSGTARLTATEVTLATLTDVLHRAGELALAGANSTTGPDQLAALAAEIDQLLEESIALGNAKFGSQYIFAGHQSTTAPFTPAGSPTTAVTYGGDAGVVEREVGPGVRSRSMWRGTWRSARSIRR